MDKHPTPAAPRRVLIVEDDPDCREMMWMLLQSAGHEVHAAADGIMAVSVARQFDPDVVILDLGLPQMDGCEVGARIRELVRPDVLLIAATGRDDRAATASAGFDVHLLKPVDPERLLQLVASPRPPGRG